jgi:glycine/D-amino acid oxidase-like deaminating enzyme
MTASQSEYGPSWYAATMVAAPERGPLTFDLDVDVCIVGGGLAGLTVAREIARRGRSVAVLEARRIAWNASGRNGGFVGPGFADRPERIVERVGLERARALWALSVAGVEYVRDTIRETGMAGVDPVDGLLYVQRVDDRDGLAAAASLISDAFGTDVEVWSTEHVRTVVRSERYFQGLQIPIGFHIHPLNYALGLAAAAEQAGARLFEHTPALALDPAGVRKRIQTPRGRVRAGHVVLAGNVHLGQLLPEVSAAVLPLTTSIAVTAPLPRLPEAITYPGAVVETRELGDFFCIVDGNRLMWGGGATTRAKPRGAERRLRQSILEVFPQLDNVEIASTWSAVMGYAVHRMPQVGEVSPGLWVLSAFGGHGLNTTAIAGKLIARAIVDGDDTWRLFSSYDLVWTGGRLGRILVQVSLLSTRLRDAAREWIARKQDKKRRHRAALVLEAQEEGRRSIAERTLRVAAARSARRTQEAAAPSLAGDVRSEATAEAHPRAAAPEPAPAAAPAERSPSEAPPAVTAATDRRSERAARTEAEAARRAEKALLAAAAAARKMVADAEFRAIEDAVRSAVREEGAQGDRPVRRKGSGGASGAAQGRRRRSVDRPREE